MQSVEALRSLGAKREIANLHGMTCLMCAACAGGDAMATCKALLTPSDASSSPLNLVEVRHLPGFNEEFMSLSSKAICEPARPEWQYCDAFCCSNG